MHTVRFATNRKPRQEREDNNLNLQFRGRVSTKVVKVPNNPDG